MSAKSREELALAETHAAAPSADPLDELLRQAAHVSHTERTSQRSLAVGTSLVGGRLSILRRLGEGGMGIVYEAFDDQRKGRVALKTLTHIDAAGVYRLKNEFRALSDVTHPNLVQLYELFAESDAWFFSMELIEGERFDHWVRPNGAFHEQRLRRALPQLVAGVAAIHAAGKLHRDLKPSNVLVTPEGRVVVLDFGLSVDPELGGVGHTLADANISGTPAYMAPEQAAGKTASAASDYYALGVMLFEALTGRLPFEGRPGEILAAKLRDEAREPRALERTAPMDLSALTLSLLARDEAARPDRSRLQEALQAPELPAPGARPNTPSAAPPELLGREAELASLRDAYRVSQGGKPVVLFVSGESGMGKSALLEAFLAELRATGEATVLASRCYERENVPYKGFDALVDELSRLLRKLPAHEAAALLPREVYALARLFPVLERVQVVADAPRREIPDPQDLKRRAFEAFAELAARLRDRRPLVLAIDDLQWVDQDSVHFMRALLVHPAPAPALLICVHRSEGAADNSLLQSVRQAARDSLALETRELALGAMPHASLVTLARRFSTTPAESDAADTFAREAQGSPFFAAELARAAQLSQKGAALTLADALTRHIGSLPRDAQTLLAVLAVAGQPLSPRLAIEAVGVDTGHALLDLLRSEQLIRVSFDGDGGRRVECYHDKIREQLVAGASAAELSALAAGLARALLSADAADPELLARVLELAGERHAAAPHAIRAAERAFAALAFDRAVTLYERALLLGEFDAETLHRLGVAHGEALAFAGQGERAGEALARAADDVSGDAALDLARKAGEQFLMCGDLERGPALLARALRPFGVRYPKGVLGILWALLAWRVRLLLRGLRYTPRSQHTAETLRELDTLHIVTHGLLRSDFFLASLFGARWVLRALQSGHETEIGRALAWELMFRFPVISEERTEALRARCEQLFVRTGDWMTRARLGYSYGMYLLMIRSEPARVLAPVQESIELVNAHPNAISSYDRAWMQWLRSTALMMTGQVTEAGELTLSLLEDAERRGDQPVAAALCQTACFALLAADRPDAAAGVMQRAAARLRSGPVTFGEILWVTAAPLPALYRGELQQAWELTAARRERCQRSVMARVLWRGMIEQNFCGLAGALAMREDDRAQRRRFANIALQMARRSRGPMVILGTGPAVVACLRADREQAVRAVRQRLSQREQPLIAELLRRRLGELLGGAEGSSVMAQADEALLRSGVVDPARFTAALLPGVEILPARPAID